MTTTSPLVMGLLVPLVYGAVVPVPSWRAAWAARRPRRSVLVRIAWVNTAYGWAMAGAIAGAIVAAALVPHWAVMAVGVVVTFAVLLRLERVRWARLAPLRELAASTPSRLSVRVHQGPPRRGT